MEITVKMTSDEFISYMAFKDDQNINEREADRRCGIFREELRCLAAAVINAVEPETDDNETFVIINQRSLGDAYDRAEDFFAD